MMDWIALQRDLSRHRKTRRLGRLLGIEPDYAAGLITRTWTVAMMLHPRTGQLPDVDPEDLADDLGWGDLAQDRLRAMVDVGVLDYDDGLYYVHDWEQHTEPWQMRQATQRRQRLSGAERQARYRDRRRHGGVTKSDADVTKSDADVTKSDADVTAPVTCVTNVTPSRAVTGAQNGCLNREIEEYKAPGKTPELREYPAENAKSDADVTKSDADVTGCDGVTRVTGVTKVTKSNAPTIQYSTQQNITKQDKTREDTRARARDTIGACGSLDPPTGHSTPRAAIASAPSLSCDTSPPATKDTDGQATEHVIVTPSCEPSTAIVPRARSHAGVEVGLSVATHHGQAQAVSVASALTRHDPVVSEHHVAWVIEQYLTHFPTRSQHTQTIHAQDHIRHRLSEGYTPQQLADAAHGASLDEWAVTRGHVSLRHVYGKPDNVDRFAQYFAQGGPPREGETKADHRKRGLRRLMEQAIEADAADEETSR